MKKILSVLMMTFVLIGMSSCSKDKDLTGTKWVYTDSETEAVEEDGVTYNMTMNTTVTIDFTSETAGKMTADLKTSVNGVEVPEFSGSFDEAFTYTYDGKGKGTMTSTDAETGETSTQDFTVEDDKLTISVTEDGQTQTIVFTKQ